MFDLLEAPVTIYAPEGTVFRLRRFINREATGEQVGSGDPTALMHRLELRGPGDHDHLWLATWDGELINPDDQDVPARWSELARIALGAWLDWENWFGANVGA